MSSSQYGTKKVIQIKEIKTPEKEVDTTVEDTIKLKEQQLLHLQQEMKQLQKQKETMVHETNVEIETAKQNWEVEKQQYIENAKQEGYSMGFEQGNEEGLATYQSLIHQANGIIESARTDYHATIEKNEESIVELAILVAERIMKQHLVENPDALLPIVRDAISSLKDQSIISIYLHPDNYEYVLQQKNELLRIVDQKADISILVNEQLAQGSCMIEHPFGKVDASIDTQLNQIRNVLYEAVMENNE